jgi:HK97 gp10 family phage protein
MTPEQSLAQFERRFAAIPVKVREKVRLAMQDQAEKLVEEMFNAAPQGATLQLAGSIGWTWGEAPKGSMVIGTVGGKEYGGLRITIYAGGGDAFYARFHEFGTVNMPASPFFFVIWRLRRARVRRAIRKAMRDAIREAMAA